MKRLLILFSLFAAACNNRPEVPKHLLQPPKMQAIMLDLIGVDGRIANAATADSLLRHNESRYRMYQQVLGLHGTSKDKFNQSLRYYEQHPPLLHEVLEGMDKDLAKQLSDTTQTKKPAAPRLAE